MDRTLFRFLDTETITLIRLIDATQLLQRSGFLVFLVGFGCAAAPAQEPAATTERLRFRDVVRTIFEDRDGNFWFGSWTEGASRFDGDSYHYYSVDDGLSDNQVRSIRQDSEGLIWFDNGIGFSSFDGEQIVTRTDLDYGSKVDWASSSTDLWFAAWPGIGVNEQEGQPGAYRYDGEKLTYLTFPIPGFTWEWSEAEQHGGNGYSVTSIARGHNGRVWFSTYSTVFGFDGQDFTVFDNDRMGLSEETGFQHARAIFEDSQGRVWIGNNGIGVLLIEDGEITRFTQEQGVGRRDSRSGSRPEPQPGDAPDGEPSLHRVFSIGEGADGSLWFGTIEQGVWRYDGESLRQFTEEDGLTTKGVLAIYQDRRGVLWFGGNGVFRFDGERFERVH